jgi:DNA-binding transcriptional ArsR family regulator
MGAILRHPACGPAGPLDGRARIRYIIRNSTKNVMNAAASTRNHTAPACAPGMGGADALDAVELASLMKALGHPARIELLRHLASVGECFFGDLSELTGLAPSTTSQHVKILREAGLIRGASQEQRVCYCIDKDRLNLLKRLVKTL